MSNPPRPASSAPPTPPEIEGASHRRSLTVEWGQCDPAGIVFNPRYFEFFDWSTALLLDSALGMNKAAMMAAYDLAGIPVVETGASFLAPARFGDQIQIVSTVIGVGRTSFRIRHVGMKAGTTLVQGQETRVWSVRDPDDPGRLRSQPIPDPVALKLRGG